MIIVNLHGVFRVEAGVSTFTLDIPESTTTVKAIIKILDTYPDFRKYWLTFDGGLSEHVLVAVNGVEINSLPEKLQTKLHPDDRLDFFSPLSGG